MLRANSIKLGLIGVLACAACGEMDKSEDPSTVQTTQEVSSVKVIDLGLVGTFMSDTRTAGDLAQLVLKTDGSFHSATFVECIAPPCNPVQEDGSYRISWRDSMRYMALLDTAGTVINRYQYELRDGALRLLRQSKTIENAEGPRPGWQVMRLDTTSWCAASSDCDLQNLPIGPCAGQWSCGENVCNWACGSISTR
jgi:hypothetical protein